jgi:hypothetical protein
MQAPTRRCFLCWFFSSRLHSSRCDWLEFFLRFQCHGATCSHDDDDNDNDDNDDNDNNDNNDNDNDHFKLDVFLFLFTFKHNGNDICSFKQHDVRQAYICYLIAVCHAA